MEEKGRVLLVGSMLIYQKLPRIATDTAQYRKEIL